LSRDTPQNPDDLLLLPEVALLTRRSEATLRWLRHQGDGPKGHRAGRRIYFRRGDVMAWLAEQERAASVTGPAA
jgi:predicted DNA-binding transcriptional regulator AlpA